MAQRWRKAKATREKSNYRIAFATSFSESWALRTKPSGGKARGGLKAFALVLSNTKKETRR